MSLIGKISKRSRYSAPTGLRDPAGWLLRAFGYAPTNTGVDVSESNAMKLTAVYACVRILSEEIASLPLIVYKRRKGAGRDRAKDHPAYHVLHDSPNPEMTSIIYRETGQSHCCLWGNSYSFINRFRTGEFELYPLLPDRTYPKRDPETKRLFYVTINDGKEIPLKKEDVLHVPALGFDGLVGYSPIRMASEAIGLGFAAEEFGARFFGQGTNMGGVIQHPATMSKDTYERLKESLVEAQAGLGKSHNNLILEGNATYTKIGIPPNDAQFIETRIHQVAEIARTYRIPLHMLGVDTKAATYASVEQFALLFVKHVLRPWLVRWEQAMNMRLFTPEEREDYYIEHLVDGVLRGDYKTRQEGLKIQREAGIINADEWREMENMNPQEGETGKIYWMPSQMQRADAPIETEPPPEPEPEADQEPPDEE